MMSLQLSLRTKRNCAAFENTAGTALQQIVTVSITKTVIRNKNSP